MNGVLELVEAAERYMNGALTGDALVSTVDYFVSSDRVYDLPDQEQTLVDAFQDALALYVSDPVKRKDFVDYLGDEDLRVIVEKFILDVRASSRS